MSKQEIANNTVEKGDAIAFSRGNKMYHAFVINVYVNSVSVKLLYKEDANELGLENDRTVVHYSNYKLVEEA
jgi:uncharacterized protein YkvS